MRKLYEDLEAWGADVDGAVARFCDNDELFVTCLHKHTEEKGYAELDDAVAAGDAEHIFDVAHMIKGVSANLGLTPIYVPACTLSDLVRDGSCEGRMDDIELATAAMGSAFARFREIMLANS